MRGTVRQAGHYSLRTPPHPTPLEVTAQRGFFKCAGGRTFPPRQQSPRGALSSSIDVLESRHSASDTAVVPSPLMGPDCRTLALVAGKACGLPRQRAAAGTCCPK